MEELKYDGKTKNYTNEIEEMRERAKGEIEGLPFAVSENFDKSAVRLIVGGHKPEEFLLTLNGARDLAMALRWSANRVEKNDLARGMKPTKNNRRK